ncbi:MAG: Ig-like domain-containing protein [Ignavibacteriaceae bacterium]
MNNIHLKKILLMISIVFLSSLIFFACKDDSTVTIQGNDGGTNNNNSQATPISVSGQVINNLTGSPIEDANVLIFTSTETQALKTDNQGKYKTDVKISANENLILVVSKENFITDSSSVFAVAGKDLSVPIFKLVPKNTGTAPSGDPVSIFLESQSGDFIGVKESGSEETARIVFVVQDSAGTPIDLDHSVDVSFKFGSKPNGGEELSPSVVKTNNNGEAVVNLTSGTKAGTVQIIAEIQIGNKKITSLPVGISIHGGLPDDNHFSIASASINFPGYNIYGLKDKVSAFVGDKYANPVRPNTAVYFTTTGGIIDGSTQTDIQGIGSVDLISAAPQPFHPIFGAGFATITATTADENSNTISDEIVVLFSGIPNISCSPTSFNIPNRGGQSFSYTVEDQNGNPLAAGTTISVSAEGDGIKVAGDTEINLPDTQSKSWTQFNFVVFDTDTAAVSRPVTVKILSTGPNGGAHLNIGGTAN